MRRFCEFAAAVALLFGGALTSSGVEAGDDSVEIFALDAIPPAPDSYILDDARLFKPREAEQLSARLRGIAEKHDLHIYIAAHSVLIGETIEERATREKGQWLGDRRGVVIGYQRGADKLTFSSDADADAFVSRSELQSLCRSAFHEANRHERGSSRVIAAANVIIEGLPPLASAQVASTEEVTRSARGFVFWALAGLVVFALAGMIFLHFLRRVQAVDAKTYQFPTVQVPTRFGAACSGGYQAEISFRDLPS